VLFFVSGVFFVFIMLLIGAEVAMRYFFSRSALWIIEISEYSLLYITFLAAAWLLKREGHVKIDFVLARLNQRAQVLLNTVTSIIGAIICSIFTWYAVKVTWQHIQLGYLLSTPLKPPSFAVVGIIALGSFMLLIQFLRRTHGFLRSRKELPDIAQHHKGVTKRSSSTLL
jgi:C4-dicarboxylate transporter DctQ subunit